MKKKLNSTPFVIVAVIILAVILVIISNRNLNKPKDNGEAEKQIPTNEQSLIDEIETIRIENTTDSDLIDIDRELDLL
jgi:large-conductance mechanosensitive channel